MILMIKNNAYYYNYNYDSPVTILIKHFESRLHIFYGVLILLHLPLHHVEELIELDTARPVLVRLGHHLGELQLGGLQAQGLHHGGQFLTVIQIEKVNTQLKTSSPFPHPW